MTYPAECFDNMPVPLLNRDPTCLVTRSRARTVRRFLGEKRGRSRLVVFRSSQYIGIGLAIEIRPNVIVTLAQKGPLAAIVHYDGC